LIEYFWSKIPADNPSPYGSVAVDILDLFADFDLPQSVQSYTPAHKIHEERTGHLDSHILHSLQ
jgi:hypothetical protein